MKKIIFVCLLGIIGLQELYAGGPWIDKKGSIYAQLGFTFLNYSGAFNSDGGTDLLPANVSDRTISGFLNYSVTDRTAISAVLPLKLVEYRDESLSNFGDISVQFKHSLLKDFPLAVYYGYTAPTATFGDSVRTGFKEHAIDLGLSAGHSNNDFYVYFSGGYKYRTNIPDQIVIDTEIGTSIPVGETRELLLAFHIDGALNTSDLDEPDLPTQNSNLYNFNGQFVSPGIKLSLNVFSDFWVNVAAFGAVFAENQGAAPSLNVGIAYNRKR